MDLAMNAFLTAMFVARRQLVLNVNLHFTGITRIPRAFLAVQIAILALSSINHLSTLNAVPAKKVINIPNSHMLRLQ